MVFADARRRKHSARIRMIAAPLLALLLGLALSSCSGPTRQDAPVQPSAATQTSEAAQVTVAVTWDGPATGPIFRVVMDTHAVDLDGYDLRQLAVLRTDRGAELRPIGWDAPKGGHHRSGTLSFPATAADGSAAIDPTTRTVELVIRDVAGVPERRFEWIATPA
jgi:hypothetical protein